MTSRSGSVRAGLLRTKAVASWMLEVSIPLRASRNRASWARGLGRNQRDRLRAVNDDTGAQVVLQVRADTHQLMARLDARGAQLVGIADAGEHEQLR
jgi:hypothetical protein